VPEEVLRAGQPVGHFITHRRLLRPDRLRPLMGDFAFLVSLRVAGLVLAPAAVATAPGAEGGTRRTGGGRPPLRDILLLSSVPQERRSPCPSAWSDTWPKSPSPGERPWPSGTAGRSRGRPRASS
jgi:hypothetical protein